MKANLTIAQHPFPLIHNAFLGERAGQTNMYCSDLISDAMVFTSSSNTSAPTADGVNPLPGQHTSLLASVMQILLQKGQKVEEADAATLQRAVTGTGFCEGEVAIELQGCPAFICILSSPVSSSLPERWSVWRGDITVQIANGSQRDARIKKLLFSGTF